MDGFPGYLLWQLEAVGLVLDYGPVIMDSFRGSKIGEPPMRFLLRPKRGVPKQRHGHTHGVSEGCGKVAGEICGARRKYDGCVLFWGPPPPNKKVISFLGFLSKYKNKVPKKTTLPQML